MRGGDLIRPGRFCILSVAIIISSLLAVFFGNTSFFSLFHVYIYIYTFTHIICQIVTLSLKEFRARACYVRQQLGKGIMKLLGMQVVSFAQLLHYSQNAPFFFFLFTEDIYHSSMHASSLVSLLLNPVQTQSCKHKEIFCFF